MAYLLFWIENRASSGYYELNTHAYFHHTSGLKNAGNIMGNKEYVDNLIIELNKLGYKVETQATISSDGKNLDHLIISWNQEEK